MPSAPVHLCVARIIADELKVKSPEQFFLGSVAPDSVNLYGFAPKEIRYEAHNRSADLSQWKKNAVALYNSMSRDDEDFAKGVLTHILTDIFWDELVQPNMLSKLGGDNEDYETLREKKWQELYRFNSLLVSQEWYAEVLRTLSKASPCNYRNIDSDMMDKYRNYLCTDYSDKLLVDKPKVLSKDMITLTAMATLTFINENITPQ